MESYFQYKRIQHAVREQLSSEKYVDSATNVPGSNDRYVSYDFFICMSIAISLDNCAYFKFSSQLSNPQLPSLNKESSAAATQEITTDSVIIVGWDGNDDPLNPANYSVSRKLFMTLLVSGIAFAVTAASAIDACGVKQYSDYFNVSEVVGSLATGK
jgi:hypothetical protein